METLEQTSFSHLVKDLTPHLLTSFSLTRQELCDSTICENAIGKDSSRGYCYNQGHKEQRKTQAEQLSPSKCTEQRISRALVLSGYYTEIYVTESHVSATHKQQSISI